MLSIAIKNLLRDKIRFLISIMGVAFAVFLMVLLVGLYNGWKESMTAYIKKIDTTFWVAQAGSADMFHSVSIMKNSTQQELKAIPDVESVDSFIGRNITFDLNNAKATLFLVGYDNDSNNLKPKKMVEGNNSPNHNEIVIDRVFAKNKKLKLNDNINISGHNFKIIGITSDSNMVISQFAFINRSDAESLLEMKGLTNYYLVKTTDQPNDVIAQINYRYPELTVRTKSEFIKVNEVLMKEFFLPIIAVLMVISFLIGILFTGLTIYTATNEKIKEYGVLKAIGASNYRLYGIVFTQSIISGIFGLAIGFIAALLVSRIMINFVSMFYVSLLPIHIILISILVLFMIIFASYVPIRKIMRIDPVNVFRA